MVSITDMFSRFKFIKCKYQIWNKVSQFSHSVMSNSLQPMDCSTPGFLHITNTRSLLKLMSIVLVTPSIHVILWHPLLHLPSIFASIKVFSSESVLPIRRPKYWRFSFIISPSNIQDWFPLGWIGCISLQSKRLSRVFYNTTVQKHQFFSAQLSL